MERRTFEDSFKEAFKGAEAGPSDQVWTNIELELEKGTGGEIRRKLFFYKLLAAAAVVFALAVSGIGLYVLNEKNMELEQLAIKSASANEKLGSTSGVADAKSQNNTAQGTTADKTEGSAESKEAPFQTDKTARVNNDNNIENTRGVNPGKEGLAPAHIRIDGVSPMTIAPESETGAGEYSSDNLVAQGYSDVTGHLPPLYKLQEPTLVFKKAEVDPVAAMMARLAQSETLLAQQDKQDKEEKTNNSERLWTSVGFAAGGFNSTDRVSSAPSTANVAYMANSSVQDNESKASGVSYSLGVSFGTKVAKRWVLQGGVNYLTQSSNYIANNVVADNNYQSLKAASVNSLYNLPLIADVASTERLPQTVPYSVNNSLKFFSVPLQAGYLLVNRKFGLQLNAGLSTDLFLQNTITPEGGTLDKTTQGSGSDSPYRSVNFSGLMGTELSYRLGQHYRVALNPGIRYPINSVYKSDVGIESTPITFDVGLRFRYIFQ